MKLNIKIFTEPNTLFSRLKIYLLIHKSLINIFFKDKYWEFITFSIMYFSIHLSGLFNNQFYTVSIIKFICR